MPSPRPTFPRLGGVAALLGAVALASGATWLPWWSESREVEYRVGPTGLSLCRSGSCVRGSLELLGSSAATWGKVGLAVAAAGLLASTLAIVVAAFALAGRSGRGVRPRPVAAAGFLAFSLGAVFAVAASSAQGMGVGPGLIAYFMGAAVIIGSTMWLLPSGPTRPGPHQ